MADSANPGGTVLGGLPAGLVRAAAGVLIVAAVVFLVLGLILPPTRELKEEKQVPVETAAQTTPTPPATIQPSRSAIESNSLVAPAMASATPTERATENKASRRPRARSMTAKVETQGT